MTLAEEIVGTPTLLRPNSLPEWTVVCGYCPRDVDVEEDASNSGELVMHVYAVDPNTAADQVDSMIRGVLDCEVYCWPIVIFSGKLEPVEFDFMAEDDVPEG